ncbi:GNAT family N-acetyltransferase [candidate division KSB1 bacterium]|nr:GNAT family N-acetyltransferase [candidate division KSB1 bacterium]
MSGKILETERLRLRPATADDIPLLYNWYSHPETSALYDGLQFNTAHPDLFAEEFGLWLDTDAELEYAGVYILELKADGRPIGEGTWMLVQRTGPDSPDVYQVGGLIGPAELRGKGYGSETLHALREFLFIERGAHRLEAMTGAFNTGAMRTLHRSGFAREGVLRETLLIKGVWHDRVIFSLLRSEWESGAPVVNS